MNLKEANKKQLLTILININKPITISKISSELNISSKTVRNYLRELQEDLNDLNIKIIRKPNIGVYLEIEQSLRLLLKNELNILTPKIYSSKYRQQYILKILFNNRSTYTIQLFADDLYCSKNTIIKDLIQVDKWLKNHDLQLMRKQNQGLWIEGNENIFRNSMVSLFHQTNNEWIIINNINEAKLDYRIDYKQFIKIKNFFVLLHFEKIQEILQNAENRFNYYFTDQAFINLIIHLLIITERAKINKKIYVDSYFLEEYQYYKEYNISDWIISQISDYLNIKISKNEITYLYLHIIGSKTQQNISIDNCNTLADPKDSIYTDIAKEIITLISEILKIDLSQDNILLTCLAIHLKPTIIRLKNKLELRNPLLSKIKKEYLSIFGATWSCNSIFEKRFNLSINEDEVGYICLHIASALDRINDKIKTVIICSSGVGTSQLVANRLKKQLPELNITNILPTKNLTNNIIEQNDLIISTNIIERNSSKAVYVSTFVNETDIIRIKDYLNKIKKKKTNLLEGLNIFHNQILDINNIISTDYCFIDNGDNSYIETIRQYSLFMEKNKIVNSGFVNSVLKREEISSTIIGYGVAIPHSQEDFVISPKITIIKLNNPILWKGEKIELIFILALKFKDISTTKLFFKNFYSLLDNKELIDKIKKAENIDEIISIFNKLY